MNVEGLLGIWDRLVIVKRKYDPDNSFRQNVNITLRNFHASKAAIMRERTKKWKETVEAKKKELKK
jgi:5-methylcytosine-specific restriction endonuclease McrA